MWRGTQGYPHDLSISTCEEVHLKHEMKAFIFTCLLAIAAAKPQPYGSDGGPTQSHDSGQYNAGGNNLAISQHEYNPAPYNPAPSQSTYNSALYKPTPYKPNPSYKIYKPQPPAPLNADGTVAHTDEYRAIAAAYQKVFEAAASLSAANPYQKTPSSAEYDPSQNGQYNPAWNNLAISQHEYNPAPYNQAPSQSTYNSALYKPTPYKPNPSYKIYKPQPPAPLNADGTVAHTDEYRAIAATHQKVFETAASLSAANPYQKTPSSADYDPSQNGQYNPAWNNLAISQHEYNPAPYNPGPSQSTYNPAPYESTECNPHPSHKNYKLQPPAPLNADGTVAHTEEYRAIAAAQQKVFEAAASLSAAQPYQKTPSSADYDPSQNCRYNPAWNNLAISQHEYKPGPSQSTYNPAPYESTECNPHPSHKNYKPQPPAPLNANGTVDHTEEYRAIAAAHLKVFEAAASLAAAHPDQTSPSSTDYNTSQNGEYYAQVYDNGQNDLAWNNLAISQQEYNPAASKPEYNLGPSHSTFNSAAYESSPYNPNPSQQNYKPQPPAPLNANGTVAHTEEYRAIAAAHQKVFEAAASLAAAHPDQTSPSSTDYNTSQDGEYNAQVYDNGQNDLAWNNLAISQQEYNPAASKPEYNLGPSHSTFNSAAYESSPYNPNPSQQSYKPQPPAPLNANGTVAHTEEYRAIAAAHQKVFEAAASLAAAHPDQTSPSSTDYNTSQDGEYNAQVYDNGQNDLAWNNLAISQQEYNPAASKPEYNLGPSHSTFNSAAYESSPYNPNPSQQNYKPQPPAPLNANGTVAHTEEYRAISAAHQKVFEAAASLAAAHPDQTSPSSTDDNTSQDGEYNAQVYDNGQNDLAWNNLAISQQEYNPAASKPEYNLGSSHSTFNSAAYESSPYNPNPSQQNYKPQPPAPLNANDTVAHIEEYRAIAAAYQKVFEAAASLAAALPDRTYPPSADYDPSQNGQYKPQVYDNGQNNPAASKPEYNPAASKPEYNPAPYESTPCNPHPSHKNYKPQPPAPLNANGTVAHTEEYRAIAAAHQKVFEEAASLAAAHADQTSLSSADCNPSQNGHVTQNQTIPKSV